MDQSIINQVLTLYHSGLSNRLIREKIKNLTKEEVKEILWDARVEYHDSVFKNLPQKAKQFLLTEFDRGISIKKLCTQYKLGHETFSNFLKVQGRKVIFYNTMYDHLRKYDFTQQQMEILIGTILGDATISNHKTNQYSNVAFGHCKVQQDYFFHKLNLLNPFMVRVAYQESKERPGFFYWYANSCGHPKLKELRNLFYHNKIKIIPEGLEPYFTPLMLSILICDDGCLDKRRNYLTICSHGFSEQDNIRLQKYFKDCMNLHATISRCSNSKNSNKYYYLKFNRKETIKIYHLVYPLLIPSMQYKLNITDFSEFREPPRYDLSDEELLVLYQKGWPMAKIAKARKIDLKVLYQRIGDRIEQRYTLTSLSEEEKEKIRTIYQETNSITAIKKLYGGRSSTIKNILSI